MNNHYIKPLDHRIPSHSAVSAVPVHGLVRSFPATSSPLLYTHGPLERIFRGRFPNIPKAESGIEGPRPIRRNRRTLDPYSSISRQPSSCLPQCTHGVSARRRGDTPENACIGDLDFVVELHCRPVWSQTCSLSILWRI